MTESLQKVGERWGIYRVGGSHIILQPDEDVPPKRERRVRDRDYDMETTLDDF
jgi:hypothetical protein